MCSFATIYGLAKMSGGNFRLGLSNDQYLFLSEIFPYFEENAKVPSMSFYPDFIRILSRFYPQQFPNGTISKWNCLFLISVYGLGIVDGRLVERTGVP